MSWLLPLKRETEKNGFSMNCEFYTNVFRKDVGMPKIIEKWYINGMRGLFRKKKEKFGSQERIIINKISLSHTIRKSSVYVCKCNRR